MKNHHRAAFAAIVVLSLTGICFSASGVTRYVSPSGGNIAPHTNWATAARVIQNAVSASVAGDEVVVSNGVYSTGGETRPGGVLLNRVYISRAITLRSVNGPAVTIIDGAGAARCVCIAAAAKLIGFTLTHGAASTTGSWPYDKCGGGLSFNQAFGASASNCVVSENVAPVGEGGGVYSEWSEFTLRNVRVSGNTATGGGGLRTSYGSVLVVNSVFSDNHATTDGGGIQLYHTAGILRNLLLTGNWTELKAGGLSFDGCSPTLENLTLVGNRAPAGRGGGIGVSYASRPVMKNCILWGNVPEQIVFDRQWYGMGLTVDHCDIQGGVTGIVTFGLGTVTWLGGNLNADPLFAGAGNYSLTVGSPCVDTGLNQPWMLEERDLAGGARIVNNTVNMGAYESIATVERPWITRIGFSTEPDGDMDVTEFYTNETFYIRIEDVDIVGGTPANRAMAGIQQRQQRKLVKEQINLTVDANGAFVGSVPLARFKPGQADIYLYGFSQGKTLTRISKINIH